MIGNAYVMQVPMPCNETLPTKRLQKIVQDGFAVCNGYGLTTYVILSGWSVATFSEVQTSKESLNLI